MSLTLVTSYIFIPYHQTLIILPSLAATGKVITSVAAGSKKDVDLAVDAAKKVRDRG